MPESFCTSCGTALKDPAGPCPQCRRPAGSSQDVEHLKLLSLFHYILAGITALFSCFPLFHVAIGIALASGSMDKGQGDPPSRVFGVFFAIMGCAFVGGGWALAVSMFVAARSLAARRRYTFCMVVAALSCLFMPFGTALGIFTIVVLMRPTVKAMFVPPNPLQS